MHKKKLTEVENSEHSWLRIKKIIRLLNKSCNFPVFLSMLFLTACQSPKSEHSTITIDGYRIFYDGQDKGFTTISGRFLIQGDTITGLFTGGPVGDMTTGKRPYLISSKDKGKTWSEPSLFGKELIINPIEWEKEALRLAIFGPTQNGTLLCSGDQFTEGVKGSGALKDPQWRDHTLNIGRKEITAADWTFTRYPTGTFLGEQFTDGWIQLPDGRLIFTIWGAKNRGENWRCGVLISDDDGITWKYRDVAYEADLNIRGDKPNVSAGFNEQSLFLTNKGKIVSIIRGRENLGRVKESPKYNGYTMDTWFLRSESSDNGETWSNYELTDIAGTGASSVGLTLPDGSFLHACRIPYSRELYKLPDPDLYGLHFARSFDEGRTWHTEHFIQSDPEGNPFTNYYNAMNGQFLKVDENEWLYIFGQFDKDNNVYRILSCRLIIN